MVLVVEGGGVFNSLLNKLPIELHIPGYNYCGPGTKLKHRLLRGDRGINPLDEACKEHDIAYSLNRNDIAQRHRADKDLQDKALARYRASDASTGEKAAAWTVHKIMGVKRRLGMGLRLGTARKSVGFRSGVVSKAKEVLKRARVRKDLEKASRIALKAAREALKSSGGRENIRTPRVFPIPKTGGFLPLVPLLSGISAIGALSGGVSGIVKAIYDIRRGRRQLDETQRHNKAMETIAMGGKGLCLKPHKKGLGLFLAPSPPRRRQHRLRRSSKN